jgi:hypothetical protein
MITNAFEQVHVDMIFYPIYNPARERYAIDQLKTWKQPFPCQTDSFVTWYVTYLKSVTQSSFGVPLRSFPALLVTA